MERAEGLSALLGLVAFTLLGGSAIRLGVGWVYRVPSASMEPTILRGEVVWADHAAIRREAPGVGDVVVFTHPSAPGLLIKRVVGVGGDTLSVEEGVVHGSRRSQRALGAAVGALDDRCRPGPADAWQEATGRGAHWTIQVDRSVGAATRSLPAVTVPAGHLLVLGDNRDHSLDSRRHGPVAAGSVVARATRVVLSLDPCGGGVRWGRLGAALAP